jgi:hypothetical protein
MHKLKQLEFPLQSFILDLFNAKLIMPSLSPPPTMKALIAVPRMANTMMEPMLAKKLPVKRNLT